MPARKARCSREARPADTQPIPELGACPQDIRHAARATLQALGVNVNADDGKPTTATILQHIIDQTVTELEIVEETLTEGSLAASGIYCIRERLYHAAQAAEVLERLNASGNWAGHTKAPEVKP